MLISRSSKGSDNPPASDPLPVFLPGLARERWRAELGVWPGVVASSALSLSEDWMSSATS